MSLLSDALLFLLVLAVVLAPLVIRAEFGDGHGPAPETEAQTSAESDVDELIRRLLHQDHPG